ncbi:tRNA uridine-5-carboxymethylaminomethyl(34) synthesis GTPase MnmE [Candidatus Palibaumannia cicadellinicola]|uniref:tRNA modification GTPase MnmE n=1 Tax=Baumannia cicadellinicola subsp. Homalodisca coagulata TaxID=374463 RepID=MNME_BAUCH|nr:tRNA uridine-5-carboxymethylaminomethyl(34) synthesis GTPase MnmE [Candidatus Baumannia cicadellinicola]Q1LTV8.1 RecName: Full=tRNA modification GTPase MnmE [Baumannia cicadellinicola str. Hc (Homalodisca coagulata)]ABF13937.1 tRNA modification GTPase TrmE [Baumannia cicadellinicola str. Hc (Homalodisca coagulata)]MBS0032661.1 tRNA uridine-5-carboxymethylaminomethyl(34) synthesis GTPase MnmE [Candidatus Baumannia cicadellinicola]MCJ7462413.1 tRNA uridine-5-carboxymethylaminomethyl(34) synthe
MNLTFDTIAAQATPNGRGGIGIVRVSGTLTTRVAKELLGKVPIQRKAEYLTFYHQNGNIIDKGIALFFPGPNSFTGEDILELHGHGGPVVLDLLLQRIITLPGVRIARPGEFSERAFLNEKIDLAQAEAIADLIDANSAQAARAAISSLQGVFSTTINDLVEKLTSLRVDIEAKINFPEENETNVSIDKKIIANLDQAILSINKIRTAAYQGCILREGIKIVITGKPNVGKSSIINALAGHEVAIVTNIAGTTRDILREYIYLDGIPVSIIDTAGLCNVSHNEVEKIGIQRAWNEIKQADHILLVVDSSTTKLSEQDKLCNTLIANFPYKTPVTIIRNKADITGEKIGETLNNNYSVITISALSSLGIEILLKYLTKIISLPSSTEGVFLARRRHLEALEITANYLLQCKEKISFPTMLELIAEDLQLAHNALSQITGKFSSHELLKKIFSRFCLGK